MTTDLAILGIGSIVTWDLQGTRITPDDLRAVLAAEGMTAEAAAVPSIDLRAAVKRAAREWAQGRGNAARYRAEVVREDGGSVQVGILRHERVSQDEVRWVQVETLTLDTGTGTWTRATGLSEGADLLALVIERATYLDHTYVRPQILQARMTEWHAFPLRRQGGAYFVAGAYASELEAMQRVVSRLGDSSLSIYTLARTEQSVQGLEQSAREHAGTTLRGLRERITGWQDRAGAVRGDAVAGMLEELRTLRGDVQFYADSLAVALDDVMADLDSAVQDAQALARAEFEAEPGAQVVRARTERTGSMLSAARKVLADAGSALTATEITRRAIEQGLIQPTGKTPIASMEARLCIAARNGEGIVRTAPRTYALAPSTEPQPEPELEAQVEAPSAPVEPEVVSTEPQAQPVASEPQEAQPEPETRVVYDKTTLDGMSMNEAVKLAKILKIKGHARLGKAQLVQAILAAQA